MTSTLDRKIEKITIFNASGRKIKEFYKPDDELKIYLMDAGIYLVIVDIEKRKIIKKVICIKE